jgi:protein involved in polysaccharide export with SLBB domain
MHIKLTRWIVGLAIALAGGQVFAQTDTAQPAAASASQLLELPLGADANKDSRVFSPARLFARPITTGVGYDLKERPPGKSSPMQLNTTIETRVENKTTHQMNEGGTREGGIEASPRPTPAPPQAPRFAFEFPDLVQNALGSSLPLFGSAWFDARQAPPALDPLTVPLDYRVGPGDELLIRAWGQIDIDFQGQIDRSGNLFLPKVGPIMVAGQKLSDLKGIIATTIGRQFKSFELTVSLGALRQIQYYVAGFARAPGIHTTESTATALHGLLASGGPLPAGDLRRIELRREGRLVATLDAYQFLVNGDKSSDPQLQPGDVIFVPPAAGFFAVAGGVRRPAIYHLQAGMTLADALSTAGGLSQPGVSHPMRVERLHAGGRRLEALSLNTAQLKQPLQDGDLLVILPSSPKYESYVTLRGNVAQPLRQAWREGLRVSDMLSAANGLIRPAAWAQRNLGAGLDVLGQSQRDVEFKRDFPEVDWAYAAIERLNPRTLAIEVIPFHLGKAIAKDANEDQLLQSGDTIVVFAKSDFAQPEQNKLRLVRVEGEVAAPGIYPMGPDDTLAKLLERAGGLSERAYLFGTVFTRESARKLEAQRLREVADRIEQDYLRYLSGRARNATAQEDSVVGSTEIEAIRSLVVRLRSMQPEGRVPLNLVGASASLAQLPAVVMEDKDSVYVPARPATVTVVGAVFRQGSLLWTPGWDAQAYLNNSGGLRQHADKSGIVVFRADGTVRQLGGWFNSDAGIHPGDTLVVPEDVQSSGWTRIFRDWSQIFYQLGLGGAALKILKSTL